MPRCRFAFVILIALIVVGCGGDNPLAAIPTSPTTSASALAEPPLALQAVNMVPDGTGVQFNTDFQFTAAGTFPSGTQFIWHFGDGSSTTTTSPTVSRIYGEVGTFGVRVEARNGATSAAADRPVTVRSIVGRWTGIISGHARFPLQRPVAITGFELFVSSVTRDATSLMLNGRWADSAGCRETRSAYLRQRLQPEPSAMVTFGVNGLACADGDFYLAGEADLRFDRVDGHCNVAGGNPTCRFQMIRE